MTQTALRLAFLGVVLAFFGATGVATAEEGRKDCSPIGTWLQVNPDTHVLAGFLSTTEGKSSDGGTLTSACAQRFSTVPSSRRTSPSAGRACSSVLGAWSRPKGSRPTAS